MVRYCTSILLGAFLLFQVQPQIARTILPWFGGGSAVWSTCMLFFQVLLLGGYVYAHLLHRFLAPGKQAVVHATLLAMSLYFLPVVPDPGWRPTGAENPTLHILLLLSATVGMPYLLLAATGPLLQSWFAQEFAGRSPYRLYALSNFGSLAALLSFPFVFEPNVRIVVQSQVWAGVYVAFGILCVICALSMARSYAIELAGSADPGAGDVTSEPAAAGPSIVASASTRAASSDVAEPGLLGSGAPGLRPERSAPGLGAAAAPAAAATAGDAALPAVALAAAAGPAAAVQLAEETAETSAEQPADKPADKPAEKPAEKPAGASTVPSLIVQPESPPAPTWSSKLAWVGLAALPSAMLLAVTNAICIDIAVVPFLWVLPLSIYLLTFILTFDSDRFCRPGLLAPLLAAATVAMFLVPPSWLLDRVGWQIGLSVGTLFLGGMVCHGQLVRTRPGAHHLTAFYLFISLGGALGGSFVAVIAPQVFTTYLEVEVCLVAAGLCAVWVGGMHARARLKPVARIVLPTLLVLGFGLGLVWRQEGRLEPLVQERNFFGTLTVQEVRRLTPHARGFHQRKVRTLNHGRTIHGKQAFGPNLVEGTGMTYYWHGTGVAHALRSHPAAATRGLRVGVIGLGAGTLAAYARPGDRYAFFEIDPAIERVAEAHFTYLKDARARGAEATVAIGDARITLERASASEARHEFDVLVVDAFSSDAIPVHLLTEECAAVYWDHLRDDGILALHVSNRHLDLEPVARGLARRVGKEMRMVRAQADGIPDANSADWILISGNEAFLAVPVPETGPGRASGEASPGTARAILWTDDFSSLWHILK